MSRSVVTREQAEKYAKEHQVTLMEARDILNEAGNFRIQPARYYRLKFDQDGFYNGTERMNLKERFYCWKFYAWRRYRPMKKPKNDGSFISLDDWKAMTPEQRDKVTSLDME